MKESSTYRYASWQPMSFNGVAAFAHAPASRVLILTALFVFLVGASLAWFFVRAYLPVLEGAMASLPEKGAIQRGFLEWSGPSEAVLERGAFLEVGVDLDGAWSFQSTADLNLVLGRTSWRLGSVLGTAELPYPVTTKIELSRVESIAWWGAWEPVLLIGLGVVTCSAIFFAWTAVALIYMPAIRVLSFLGRRRVTLLGCWKLCLAALLPGTLLCVSAIFMYGLYRIPMVALLFVPMACLIIHSVYVVLAVTRLPAVSDRRFPDNPFASSAPESGLPRDPENPFS